MMPEAMMVLASEVGLNEEESLLVLFLLFLVGITRIPLVCMIPMF